MSTVETQRGGIQVTDHVATVTRQRPDKHNALDRALFAGIAAPVATLSIMEARWGLVPDMGITQSLTRLVPIDVAKELTFTARRLSGEDATEIGLVTHVAQDPLAAAQKLATEIAGRSPDAV